MKKTIIILSLLLFIPAVFAANYFDIHGLTLNTCGTQANSCIRFRQTALQAINVTGYYTKNSTGLSAVYLFASDPGTESGSCTAGTSAIIAQGNFVGQNATLNGSILYDPSVKPVIFGALQMTTSGYGCYADGGGALLGNTSKIYYNGTAGDGGTYDSFERYIGGLYFNIGGAPTGILTIQANNTVNGSLITGICANVTSTNTTNSSYIFCNQTGTTLTTTFTFLNGNITVYDIGSGDGNPNNATYFNQTLQNINYNSTMTVTAQTYQALINVTALQLYTNTQVTGFNVTNNLLVNNTLLTLWDTLPANNGTNNVRVQVAGNYSVPNITCTVAQPFTISSCSASGFYDDILRVGAKNAVNGTPVYNFTLVISNNTLGGNFLNASTINGTAYLPLLQNYYYFLAFNGSGYTTANASVLANNFTQLYNFTLFTTNSVNLSSFDQTSKALISTQPTTVQMVGTYQQYNFTLTNGTGYVDLLAPDTYTTTFSSAGYFTAAYTITIVPQTTQSLSGYLLNSTPATNQQVIFTLTDTTNQPIVGGLVLVEQLVNTTYITTDARPTDVTGQARVNLDNTKIYRFTFSASGYVTKQAIFQPVSTTYTVRLLGTGNAIPQSFNDYVSVTTYPNSTMLQNGVYSFSLTVSSTQGSVQTANISLYNGSDYFSNLLSGSPNGGTVSVTFNGTNFSGSLPVTYTITTFNGTNTTFMKIYYFVNYSVTSNNTIGSAGSDLNGAVSDGGKIILAVILTLAAMVAISVFLTGYWLGLIGVLMMIVMTAIGLLPIGLAVLFGGLIVVEAIVRGGE